MIIFGVAGHDEAGRAFEAATIPAKSPDMRPVDLDIRTAFDMEKAAYHTAQRLAEQGAAMARQARLEADGLAVADDVTVARQSPAGPRTRRNRLWSSAIMVTANSEGSC